MIKVQLIGQEKYTAYLQALPSSIFKSLITKVTSLTYRLEAYIKDNKLSGQVLKHKSGRLWQSIQSDIKVAEPVVTGKVFSAGDVKYAGIHEYGGIINHPGGTAYMYIKGVGVVFVSNAKAEILNIMARTKPHQIPMPERSYMRSSLAENEDNITSEINDAVADGIAS